MLDVICWLWKPSKHYRSQYTVEHVNILRSMVERAYPHPHRFSCITDQTGGFHPAVRVIPIWDDFAELDNAYGRYYPSCYRRLKVFSPEVGHAIGERFVSLDLDCVITADVTDLWHRKEDLVLWKSRSYLTPINASMWLMSAGAHPEIWDRFRADPKGTIRGAVKAHYFGSDQSCMNYILGKSWPYWDENDGVLSYTQHVRGKKKQEQQVPEGAKIVMFYGDHDPDHPQVQFTCPWVREYYK